MTTITTTTTIASIGRISAATLRDWILARKPVSGAGSGSESGAEPFSFAVVDVRDDDYIGGHIKDSINCPSRILTSVLPGLARRLADRDAVVFHCALSQQRGPSAALAYAHEREGMAKVTKMMKKVREEREEQEEQERQERQERQEKHELSTTSTPTTITDKGENKDMRPQKIYVLDRGFVGWQEKYGEDENLTVGYRKELWQEDDY